MMFVSMKYNENSFKEKIRKYYQYPNENNCTSLLCVIDSLNAAIRDYNIELHKKIGNLQKKIEYDSTSILDNKYEIDTLKNKLRIDSLQKNILKTDVLIMTNKTAILSLVKQINLIKYPTKITYNNKKYSDWE